MVAIDAEWELRIGICEARMSGEDTHEVCHEAYLWFGSVADE